MKKNVIKYIIVFILALITSLIIFFIFRNDKNDIGSEKANNKDTTVFLGGETSNIKLYDETYTEVETLFRGTQVKTDGKKIINELDSLEYQPIKYNGNK